MGFALLMMATPAEEPGAAAELRREIAADQQNVSSYRAAFDPYPSFTQPASFSTQDYPTAKRQVDALKGLLKGLASKYGRFRFRYRVLLRNDALAESWEELRQSVSDALDLVDKTRPANYSRSHIWEHLEAICSACEDLSERLDELINRESRLLG